MSVGACRMAQEKAWSYLSLLDLSSDTWTLDLLDLGSVIGCLGIDLWLCDCVVTVFVRESTGD